MRLFFIFLFSISFTWSLSAQFNVKVGYSFTYSNPTVHNELITLLNGLNSSSENYNSMPDLHGFHGMMFGARQRFGFVALNAELNSRFSRKSFDGKDLMTNAIVERKHFYGYRSYSLGLEFFVKNISFGGNLDFNRFRIRAETSERADRHTFFEDENFAATFFISGNLYGSDQLTLSIQPFIQIPLTNFDLEPLKSELNIDATNLDDYEEGLMNFGIRIVFQNGYYDKD